MEKIATLLETFSPEWDFSKENLAKKGKAILSLPENIFWDPAGKNAAERQTFWERSVQLGGQLIECGCKGIPWQKKEFLDRLLALRKEVKALIFEPPSSVTVNQPVAAEKEAIRTILLGILEKWRRESRAKKEDIGDTIILSIRETDPNPQLPRPSLREEQETIPETVILSGAQAAEKRGGLDHTIPETRIISLGKDQPRLERAPRPSSTDREEEKTRLAGDQKKTRAAAPQKELMEDDLLSETVILGPEKLRELAKKKGT